MAEKKASTRETYEKIMSELRSGNVAPVYLLMGEEAYYIDQVSDYITANVLAEEEKDFNLTVVYGPDTSAREVINNASRYPIMAARQVIVVREAQKLKDFDLFEKYLQKPVATTVLVLCCMGKPLDGRKKTVTGAAAVGRVLVSDPPKYDRDIVAFINDYVKRPEYNAKIDSRTAYVVASCIGGDLKRLASELDKLLVAFPEGQPRVITNEMIEQHIGISKQYNIFELRDALINKDAVKAFRIIKFFDDNPKAAAAPQVLVMLFNFFRDLMLCYYAPRPVNESAIMAQLNLPKAWFAKDFVTGMRNFTPKKTLAIISKIKETDTRIKGINNVNTPAGELMKELIAFILE